MSVQIIIDAIAVIFLIGGWYLLIGHIPKKGRLNRRDSIILSLAVGLAISASHILAHLEAFILSSNLLADLSLFYSIFLPALSVYLALNLKSYRHTQALLISAGIVASHYTISNTHTPLQFFAMWLILALVLRIAIYLLTSSHRSVTRCSDLCRRWSAILLVTMTIMLIKLFPETGAGPVLTGRHDLEAIYSLLAANGLFLLYLYLLLSIKKKQLSLWRVVFAIMMAEFAIMFLLPPILGSDLPEWISAVVDALLLSIFMFPVLYQQHQTSQLLATKSGELETTLLAIKDGVIVCNADGKISHFNRSAEGLTGYVSQQVVGRPVTEIVKLIDESTSQVIPSPAMRCIETQTIVEVANHAVIEHKKGQFIPVEHTASPIFNSQGQLAGVILICRDVTERRNQKKRRQQEKELTQLLNDLLSLEIEALSEQQLLQICLDEVLKLSWLPVQPRGGIFVTEHEQLQLIAQTGLSGDVSQNCAHITFGYCLCGRAAQSQQIIYKSCLDSEHEFQHEGMQDHGHYNLPMVHNEETIGVMVLYLDHGHLFNLREQEALATITSSITHLLLKKRTHHVLQLSHQVLQHSHQGIIITDENNQIIDVNPAFSRITGYALHDVVGKTPAFLYSGRHDRLFYQQMWQSILDQGKWEGEIWNKAKDGTIYPEWLSITTIEDKQGKIQYHIAIFTDLSQIKEAENHVSRLAYFDTLTELPNRAQLDNTLRQVISNAQRNNFYLAILFLDLDRFKAINDTHGHQVGDDVLTVIGKRINNTLREGDIAARWGGDEFAILLQSNSLDNIRKEARHVADKLINLIKTPISCGDKLFNLDVSIGISIYPEDAQDAEQLLQYADMTMYQVKQHNPGGFRFFSQALNEQLTRRNNVEQLLRFAIENKEFELFYQPKVRIDTQKVVGFEALLRWHNEELGIVSPAEFIPVAEETKLIIDIDLWVFEQVCEQLACWYSDGLWHSEDIAVNIASRHFQSPQFIKRIVQMVDTYHIPPKSIQIEITETGLMEQGEQALIYLESLKQAGFDIAIDDFGTGYSSLGRLKDFPIDLLKIDRSFILDIAEDENDRAIVLATINMAKALGIQVCAEGIEEQVHAEILNQYGCEFGQGYFYARPMSAKTAEQVLIEGLHHVSGKTDSK